MNNRYTLIGNQLCIHWVHWRNSVQILPVKYQYLVKYWFYIGSIHNERPILQKYSF